MAEEFFKETEKEISSFSELEVVIDKIMSTAGAQDRQFVWRGQVDAGWPLHSSLYRRVVLTEAAAGNKKSVDEIKTGEWEDVVLNRLYRWGLHNVPGRGRLSLLNQLAMLQHFGAPTRLIDISFNAWVGVFFAVEQKWLNSSPHLDNIDCRLFAIDVTDRIINDDPKKQSWEDSFVKPWANSELIDPKEWTADFYAWKPASIDSRIAAQNGGFLFGGIPNGHAYNNYQFQYPQGVSLEQGRLACCLALRPHKFDKRNNQGRKASQPCYTFRIKAAAKADIRKRLELLFGYKHSTIYPDYTGFSDFAVSDMRRS